MNKKFQEHFDGYRKLIQDNLNTIRGLIGQSEKLSNIIETLNGTDTSSKDIKASLLQNQETINESITNLYNNTEKLFTSYKKFIQDLIKDNS